MKILIEVPYGASLALDSDAAQLMPAILSAQLVTQKGYGADAKYEVVTDNQLSVKIVRDDSFAETPEPLAKLQTANAEANSRWSAEYTAHAATKKKLAEAEAKLASITQAAS